MITVGVQRGNCIGRAEPGVDVGHVELRSVLGFVQRMAASLSPAVFRNQNVIPQPWDLLEQFVLCQVTRTLFTGVQNILIQELPEGDDLLTPIFVRIRPSDLDGD